MSYIRFVGITLWSVFSITLSLFLKVITRKQELPLRMARNFWSPIILACAGGKLNVKGLENVDPNKSYLVVSNHQSFLDIAALFRAIPVNLHFIGKEELKKMPFIGWFMKSMGMIFVDRSDRRKSLISLKKAAQLIQNGKSVLIFPEGTRSKTGEIQMFKKGGFFIAQISEVNLLPVKITGANKVWPYKGMNFKPGKVELTIGQPFKYADLEEKDLAEFANKVRQKVIDLA